MDSNFQLKLRKFLWSFIQTQDLLTTLNWSLITIKKCFVLQIVFFSIILSYYIVKQFASAPHDKPYHEASVTTIVSKKLLTIAFLRKVVFNKDLFGAGLIPWSLEKGVGLGTNSYRKKLSISESVLFSIAKANPKITSTGSLILLLVYANFWVQITLPGPISCACWNY